MSPEARETASEPTRDEDPSLAFQIAACDLGPYLVDAVGRPPDEMSPLARDLAGYVPGSSRPSSDLDAVLAHPRARDVAAVTSCPSLRLWGRTGGGRVPVSTFAMCGRPATHPDLFVVVSPSFEDAFLIEVLDGVEEVAVWWGNRLASPAEGDVPNLLPPPVEPETLVYAFHTIDAFRRVILEGMLAYATTDHPVIAADEFSDSLHRSIRSRDLRWLLPAFLHLVPGLDVAGLNPTSEHLAVLTDRGLLGPSAERQNEGELLVFGEAGIALGTEFHHGWLSSAGFELLVRSAAGPTCVERGFLAPTPFTNHLVLLHPDDRSAANHQAMTRSRLIATVGELVDRAVLEAREPQERVRGSRHRERKADGPCLIVQSEERHGERVALGERVTVGRGQDNDIVLQDNATSRHHAVLVHNAGTRTLTVEDLGSTNGTWVNGTRIQKTQTLSDGDELLIGETRFTVELGTTQGGGSRPSDQTVILPGLSPPPYCPACGGKVSAGASFCGSCGASLTIGSRMKRVDDRSDRAAVPTGEPCSAIAWTQETPILGNSVLTKQILLVSAFAVVFIEAMFSLVSGRVAPLMPLGAGVAILLALLALVMVLVFGNRQRLEVVVSETGVRYTVGASRRRLTRALLGFAMLAGSTQGTAAGLTATASERGELAWTLVSRARVDDRRNRIVLYRLWFPLIELTCPKERFDAVRDIVRRRVTA